MLMATELAGVLHIVLRSGEKRTAKRWDHTTSSSTGGEGGG